MLVDDHPALRAGIAQAVNRADDMEVCGEAASLSEAMPMFDEVKPSVLLVDLSLEDGSGLELIKQVKARDESVKMLVASMHDERLYAERALRAGALGYISKDRSLDEIIEAIRQVMRGRMSLSPEMSDRVLKRVMSASESPEASPIDSLSDRELEVFELIGHGYTTRQIADKLHLSTKTIDTHREHMKEKLGIESINDLVRYSAQWLIEEA